MPQAAHHADAFAGARMVRVLDQNLESLFLGSISLMRYLTILLEKQAFLSRIG